MPYHLAVSHAGKCMYTPDNGLGQIQIQLDFGFWLLLDLDIVGHGYPLTLDLIGLDFVG